MSEPKVRWSVPEEANAELERRGFRLLAPGVHARPWPPVGSIVHVGARALGKGKGRVKAHRHDGLVEVDCLLPGDVRRTLLFSTQSWTTPYPFTWTLLRESEYLNEAGQPCDGQGKPLPRHIRWINAPA
jgi:hypothetical protein